MKIKVFISFSYLFSKKFKLISICVLVLFTNRSNSQTAYFTTNDTIGCAPLTINFTNLSIGASSFYWDFDDGLNSNQANPTHIFYGTGIYYINLYAYDSLMNADTFILAINIPATLPYFNLTSAACPGKNLEFTVFGNFDLSNIVNWDFGDGSSSNLSYTNHSYSNPGVYDAVLTVSNSNCGIVKDTNQITISNSIFPSVHIHPDYGITTICPGENFPFYYDEANSIFWDFGNNINSSDPYPIHSYDSAGIYNVSITVTNECSNSSTLDTFITVDSNNIPLAAIYPSSQTPCPNETISFSAYSAFDHDYYWNFGDGINDTGQTVNHQFSDTGIYNISLVIRNECNNTDTDYVTIHVAENNIINGWIQIENKEVCPGGTIQFNAAPGFTSYLWYFGDGDSSFNASNNHSYTDTGIYFIRALIGNGCGNIYIYEDTISVTNSLYPIANFEFNQKKYCISDNISFSNKSSIDAVTFYWDFGDTKNDSMQNPSHKFDSIGLYSIKLIVNNNCGNPDTMVREIIIDSSSFSVSDFNINPQLGSCIMQNISFTNFSSDTSTVLWYFGDGDSSNLVNPIHQYSSAGNHFTQLLITNGCNLTSTSTNLVTISNSYQLEAPNLSCNVITDTILFSWNAIDQALGYEISKNGSSPWVTPSGPGRIHSIVGIPDSTYSLVVRAKGNETCNNGHISNSASCSIITGDISYERDKDYFLVFPNPSTGIFNLWSNQNEYHKIDYLVFNLLGRLIWENSSNQNKVSIDLSGFDNGVYYLKVKNKNINDSKILIISR